MTSAAPLSITVRLALLYRDHGSGGHFDETESNAPREGRKTTQAAI